MTEISSTPTPSASTHPEIFYPKNDKNEIIDSNTILDPSLALPFSNDGKSLMVKDKNGMWNVEFPKYFSFRIWKKR